MRTICVVIAACLPLCGLAQGVVFSGGGGGGSSNGNYTINGTGGIFPGGLSGGPRPMGIGSLQPDLRLDPSGGGPRAITFSYRGHSKSGTSYFTRTLIDTANQQLFGYEILLEERQPGTYLASFGKLPVSSMEVATSDWRNWKVREIPLPEPRTVHDGDVITIELMTDAATGRKLYEDIKIAPFPQPALARLAAARGGITGALPSPARNLAVPTAEGAPRDFTAADAEMQIRQPRVTLNGTAQPAPLATPIVNGSLIWFYLPGRGRYVLSLAPRPELDFQQAGELRGGSIRFTVGGDTITLECPIEIASGHAPYHLYVLHDPSWEPTAQAQKGQFAIGSVDAGELVKLKRQ